MYKERGVIRLRKTTFILIFVLMATLLSYSFSQPLNPGESMETINSTISELSDEELEILQLLFLIKQEINELEIQETKTEEEIELLSLQIVDLEARINLMEISYEDNLLIMEEVLKSYQKKGPLSNLQLILSSDTLATLLRRINSIRDLSRNTAKLLQTIEDDKEELSLEREQLADTLAQIEVRRDELRKTIQAREETVASLEESLQELQDERDRYEAYLQEIDKAWDSVKPVFLETIAGITETVESGQLPESMLNIQISLTGIRGRILDRELNEELGKKSFPSTALLLFQEDHVRLVMPDLNLEIKGNLVVYDNKTVRFEITDGIYMGLSLEKSAVMELFDFGYLDLKFHSLLGNNTIRSIDLGDGYMDLSIRPSLF